jgi:hypothetical protein
MCREPVTFGADIEVPVALPYALSDPAVGETSDVPFPIISGLILKSFVGPSELDEFMETDIGKKLDIYCDNINN